jgi:hypothetical protein
MGAIKNLSPEAMYDIIRSALTPLDHAEAFFTSINCPDKILKKHSQ